jgi:hypothetical protein
MLHPRSGPGYLCKGVTDITAADADVLEVPVTEMTQHGKRCLAFVTRDRGGNPPIDEAAEARHKDCDASPDCRRSRSVV